MRAMPGLLLLLGLVVPSPVLAWDSGDRQLYYNKMALLRVLLDGAQSSAPANLLTGKSSARR